MEVRDCIPHYGGGRWSMCLYVHLRLCNLTFDVVFQYVHSGECSKDRIGSMIGFYIIKGTKLTSRKGLITHNGEAWDSSPFSTSHSISTPLGFTLNFSGPEEVSRFAILVQAFLHTAKYVHTTMFNCYKIKGVLHCSLHLQ